MAVECSLQNVDAKMRKVYHERPSLPQRVMTDVSVPDKVKSTPSDMPASTETSPMKSASPETHPTKSVPSSSSGVKNPTPSSRSNSRRFSFAVFSFPVSIIPGFDNFVRLNLKRHINVRRRRHAYSPVNSLPSPDESFSQIEDNDLPQQSKEGNGSGPGLLEEEVVELMMEKTPPPGDTKEDGRSARRE